MSSAVETQRPVQATTRAEPRGPTADAVGQETKGTAVEPRWRRRRWWSRSGSHRARHVAGREPASSCLLDPLPRSILQPESDHNPPPNPPSPFPLTISFVLIISSPRLSSRSSLSVFLHASDVALTGVAFLGGVPDTLAFWSASMRSIGLRFIVCGVSSSRNRGRHGCEPQNLL